MICIQSLKNSPNVKVMAFYETFGKSVKIQIKINNSNEKLKNSGNGNVKAFHEILTEVKQNNKFLRLSKTCKKNVLSFHEFFDSASLESKASNPIAKTYFTGILSK